MKKKIYLEEIMDKFYDLSNSKKVDILMNALGIMSSYNGQSEKQVIAKAMGYEYDSDEAWIKVKE